MNAMNKVWAIGDASVDTVNACNSFHHCHLLRLPDDRHNNDSDIPRCRFIRHAFLRYQQLML